MPGHIRSDNGPEFVAQAVREWIAAVGAKTAYIEPGSPWENGYCESFNSKLRDELLNGDLLHAAGGPGDHRELETALQHCSPALFARLSATRTGGLHPRAPGFAVWISYARRALAGAKTNPKLTSQPDHSIGAGQQATRSIAVRFAPVRIRALTFRKSIRHLLIKSGSRLQFIAPLTQRRMHHL